MPEMSATVEGWRTRASKRWYPSAGGFVDCSTTPSVNCNAGGPTDDDGNQSNQMYTTIIKLVMPSDSGIDSISSISIDIVAADNTSSSSSTLCASLRTVDDSTSAQYSVSDYRTYVAGGSSEVSVEVSSKTTYNIKFTGTFAPGDTYYIWLYTKSASTDLCRIYPSSDYYTCTIVYKAKTYRVTYNANGGSGAPSYVDIEYNGTCTVSSTVPTKTSDSNSSTFVITGDSNGGDSNTSLTATKTVTTNYTFKGWSTSSTASTASYNGGSTFTVKGNTTLYAVWESTQSTSYTNNTLSQLATPTKQSSKAVYTFTLNYNNGSSQEVRTLQKSATYSFSGWSTTRTGSVISNSTTFTSETTVYAIWDVDGVDTTTVTLPTPTKDTAVTGTYTITLEADGGTVSSKNLTANINTVYTFKGWSTTSSASNIVGSPYLVTQNTTLNAIYDSYTVTDSVKLPTAVKDAYSFTGWSEVQNSDVFVSNPYLPTKNITLYANYKLSRGIKVFLWHDNSWYRIMVDGM